MQRLLLFFQTREMVHGVTLPHNYAPRVLDAKIVVWLRLPVSTTWYIHDGNAACLTTLTDKRDGSPCHSSSFMSIPSGTGRETYSLHPTGRADNMTLP